MKMSYNDLKRCVICAYLHDVGKTLIPSEVLQKEGKLTDEEYEIMKSHTTLGYEICKRYNEFKDLALIVRSHHENIDGTGYPNGLKGSQIPLEASIIKIADVYDALTKVRQYKKPFSRVESMDILIKDAKANKLSAAVLKYLFQVVIEDNYRELKEAEYTTNQYEEILNTLHELEDIYKQIYDIGQTRKLMKKLNKYKLAPGYDMSINANLIASKQKVLEREKNKLQELIEESKSLKKQYDTIIKLAKKDNTYYF